MDGLRAQTLGLIDDLDRAIVNRLHANPLEASASISRDFGVANATVGTRIRRLNTEGFARVIGATRTRPAGYSVVAWVQLKIADPSFKSVIDRLVQIPELISIGGQTGDHQVGMFVVARDHAHLQRICRSKIDENEGVASAIVDVLLSVEKLRTDISPGMNRDWSAQSRYEHLKQTLLMEKCDELDLRILAELQADGRLPLREIARRTDVSEGTIRGRTKVLQSLGLLIFITVLHPKVYGHRKVATIRLQTKPSASQGIVEQLVKMDEVSTVVTTSGSFNILIIASVQSELQLFSMLNENILCNRNVLNCQVSDLVIGYKFDPAWIISDT